MNLVGTMRQLRYPSITTLFVEGAVGYSTYYVVLVSHAVPLLNALNEMFHMFYYILATAT